MGVGTEEVGRKRVKIGEVVCSLFVRYAFASRPIGLKWAKSVYKDVRLGYSDGIPKLFQKGLEGFPMIGQTGTDTVIIRAVTKSGSDTAIQGQIADIVLQTHPGEGVIIIST